MSPFTNILADLAFVLGIFTQQTIYVNPKFINIAQKKNRAMRDSIKVLMKLFQKFPDCETASHGFVLII